MPGRTPIALILFALVGTCVAGCSGEKGAKVTGVLIENGEPLRTAERDRVTLSLVPTQKDDKNIKANPGAVFKPADASFVFIGPGLGLVPSGEYKVCLTVRPREGDERFSGQFKEENTPLTLTVADEPKLELVIDLTKKTVTRK